ncbi:hypothetical protein FIBSPDRAFT_834647 [Athelia psychrophila]|uniref:Uncharacterized protein n=1 Tax=Athelia psychrophila TaxID=1759441 RepID=A0A166CL83_9AGAM|nr:hypothetical protein FIBSPDRAFT_834647 [Fibularhizoctonia sp. CBS 109695]
MLLSPRKTPLAYVLAITFTVTVLLLSFHPKAAPSYAEFSKPIKDYFSSLPVACPSVYDAGRPALDHSTQTCYPVPSNHTAFALEVCYAPDTCNQFTARISRTSHADCQAAEDTPDPSKDEGITRWMREKRGPDAFYLRTDGAERYASVLPEYDGGCKYHFDVRLKNPGDAYLQIWWTEQRYTGFSDTNASWPEMLLDPLSAAVQLKTCPSRCKMQISKPLLPSKIVSIPPSPPVPSSARLALPDCTGPDPITGSYIPAHPMDILYPPEVLPQPNNAPVVGRYTFVPEACVWRHAGLRFGNPDACSTRPAKMFITGDSHGRVSYDAMLHRLKGNTENLLDSEKTGHKSGSVGNLDINFLWDPRGIDFLNDDEACAERVQGANIIVLSTVAHYDDSPAPYVFSQVREMMSAVAACPYTPTPGFPIRKQILLYAPAVVQRQDEFVRKYKDHGTNLRMAYWRDEIYKIARELNWEFVDQLELTLPHSLEPLGTDMAHFLANDAIDPIIDELLGKTGLCDYTAGVAGNFRRKHRGKHSKRRDNFGT